MKLINKQDIDNIAKDGRGVKLVKSNETKTQNASVVIQSPEVKIDNSTNISEESFKNLEKLLKEILLKEIPASVTNVEVKAPTVEVKPPEIKIDNKASEIKIDNKNIEILLKELILQKKTPVQVNIPKAEAVDNGWDKIKFTITRDEKGFMKEVTAIKGE